ncbi:hypothetical protein [Pararhodobacter sp.]|uniref:hypothetical protein n=1 Tax=Pararhodobacter sp. TaxID=2127056 RepID=UPI002FE0EBB2
MKTFLLSAALVLTAAGTVLAASGPGSPSPTAPGTAVVPSVTPTPGGPTTFFTFDITSGGTIVFTVTGENGSGPGY